MYKIEKANKEGKSWNYLTRLYSVYIAENIYFFFLTHDAVDKNENKSTRKININIFLYLSFHVLHIRCQHALVSTMLYVSKGWQLEIKKFNVCLYDMKISLNNYFPEVHCTMNELSEWNNNKKSCYLQTLFLYTHRDILLSISAVVNPLSLQFQ